MHCPKSVYIPEDRCLARVIGTKVVGFLDLQASAYMAGETGVYRMFPF